MSDVATLRVITPYDVTVESADARVGTTIAAELHSADALNAICDEHDPQIVVVGNASGPLDVAALESATRTMLSHNAAGCWLPLTAGSAALAQFELPGWIAVHVRGADDAGLAMFKRESGERLFRDSPAPIADRLRELARGGRLAEIHAPRPIAALAVEFDWPELTPQSLSNANRRLADAVHDLNVPDGCHVVSRTDWIALKAGLLQACDDLDGSHTLASEVQGAGKHVAGDYWHAIMHRREPDYGNSKYWFRRVGRHPAFSEVAAVAHEILAALPPASAGSWSDRLKLPNDWDPFAFVDLAQEAAGNGSSELHLAVRQIQWAEIVALLRQTCDDAFKDEAGCA